MNRLYMWWFNISEVLTKIDSIIFPPPPLAELKQREAKIKLMPDSPAKHFKLSIVYREMVNSYMVMGKYSDFDYSSQIKSYSKLAVAHRTIGIQLTKEAKMVSE